MAALAVQNMSLAFASAQVLRDVSFDVAAGELVALVGHNGSGKSTIVKVLSGFHAPDQRSAVSVRGRQVSLPMRPDDQLTFGIAIVHQDLALIGRASVWENVGFGGYQQGPGGMLDTKGEKASARRLLRGLNCEVDVDGEVGELDMPDQACVAIARALRRIEERDRKAAPNLLILDEATNFFSHEAAMQLLGRLRKSARAIGMGVLVISHRIAELLEACDRVIVLRDGLIVAERDAAVLKESDVVQLMIGGKDNAKAKARATGKPEGEITSAKRCKRRDSEAAMRLDGLRVAEGDQPVDLAVGTGEVVGLTGLKGASWEAIVPIVGGDRTGHDGTIRINAASASVRDVTPNGMIKMGVGYVPSEQTRAAAFELPAVENFWAPRLAEFVRLGALRSRLMTEQARARMIELRVTPPEPERKMGLFSGGNRQKLIVGRWLVSDTRVLALDEPTQGIDIAARAELIDRIRGAAAQGVAVLVASQDYRDLAAMCDRVVAFTRETTVLVRPDLNADAIAACF